MAIIIGMLVLTYYGSSVLDNISFSSLNAETDESEDDEDKP